MQVQVVLVVMVEAFYEMTMTYNKGAGQKTASIPYIYVIEHRHNIPWTCLYLNLLFN